MCLMFVKVATGHIRPGKIAASAAQHEPCRCKEDTLGAA
jgi:hypothetical protein